MRMRLWGTPSRPAKGRLSSNGTLGTMFTDSPLEYAAVSVLQPGWGPLLVQDTPSFTVGWCSGVNSWVGMEQDPDTSTTSCKLSHCTRDPVSGRPQAWLALNISKVQVFCNPLLPSTVGSPHSCSCCLRTLFFCLRDETSFQAQRRPTCLVSHCEGHTPGCCWVMKTPEVSMQTEE